jgi:hypothetical protein
MSNSLVKLFVSPIFLIVIAVALLCVPSAAIPTTTMAARPKQEINYDYYTDATYTTVCGTTVIACNGVKYRNGCVTPYYTVMYIDC